MICGVRVYPNREIIGIQRTFLKQDGSGKAPVEPAKMSLGSIAAGTVQLYAEPAEILGLAEGVETALSVFQLYGIPTWAALGSSNLPRIALPQLPDAEEVHLYIDGDAASNDAMVESGKRYSRQGRLVKVFPAPDGMDFNDLIREGENEFSV